MNRPSLVEVLMALVFLVPAAGAIGWGVGWALGVSGLLTGLLTAAVPLLGAALQLLLDFRRSLRRRRALRRFAALSRPVATTLAPGLLWTPAGTLEARPNWNPSAHERLHLERIVVAAPPIPVPEGWTAAALLYYGKSAQNDTPGLWMDRAGRLHLAHLKVAGSPFFPEILPAAKDTP